MDLHAEWLEADGLGGYSSGTIGGLRTRRYHALLLAAAAPPTGRQLLVNGLDAFVETAAGRFALSTQKYAPDVVAPDGRSRVAGFTAEPWPTWTFRLEDGTEIVQELFAVHGAPLVVVTWRLKKRAKRGGKVTLTVRPFLSGRDHHALHHRNDAFRFDADLPVAGAKRGAKSAPPDTRLAWRPYAGVAGIACVANGVYRHDPHWYTGFLYDEELARGFEASEDLGAPGEFTFDLAKGEAIWIVGAFQGASARDSLLGGKESAAALVKAMRATESKRRAAFASPLHRAADAYLVQRGAGKSIVAGYPWFADWGRDTFLALRGLCLATGRLEDARAILLEWAGAVSQGMLPNRFPDQGEAPEYNTVDGSLWFVVALEELLAAAKRSRRKVVSAADTKKLLAAVRAILEAHLKGTRFGIKIDEDELLAAGERGQQLTWMDARVEGREVTPRIGKAVEIEALWYNAISFAATVLKDGPLWKSRAADVHDSFLERFWNERDGCLYDVIDVDHVKGSNDAAFRPNQILAIGGLARPLLVGPRARKVVDAVEARLVTPMGLRTLAPDDSRFHARYEGGPAQRDAAYHQGTVWPWLMGPFVDAWVRVRGGTPSARREAQRRFVQPLLDAMAARGVPHLCEISDAQPPHGWKGAPFQAWSLGELLRVAPDSRWSARSPARPAPLAAKAAAAKSVARAAG